MMDEYISADGTILHQLETNEEYEVATRAAIRSEAWFEELRKNLPRDRRQEYLHKIGNVIDDVCRTLEPDPHWLTKYAWAQTQINAEMAAELLHGNEDDARLSERSRPDRSTRGTKKHAKTLLSDESAIAVENLHDELSKMEAVEKLYDELGKIESVTRDVVEIASRGTYKIEYDWIGLDLAKANKIALRALEWMTHAASADLDCGRERQRLVGQHGLQMPNVNYCRAVVRECSELLTRDFRQDKEFDAVVGFCGMQNVLVWIERIMWSDYVPCGLRANNRRILVDILREVMPEYLRSGAKVVWKALTHERMTDMGKELQAMSEQFGMENVIRWACELVKPSPLRSRKDRCRLKLYVSLMREQLVYSNRGEEAARTPLIDTLKEMQSEYWWYQDRGVTFL
jgi:hypothetical protein